MPEVVVAYDYYSDDIIGVFDRIGKIIPPSLDSVMDVFELQKTPFWSSTTPPSKEALFSLIGFCTVCNGREIPEFDRMNCQVRTQLYHTDLIEDKAAFHLLPKEKGDEEIFLFDVARSFAETHPQREMLFDVYRRGYLEGGTTEFDDQYW